MRMYVQCLHGPRSCHFYCVPKISPLHPVPDALVFIWISATCDAKGSPFQPFKAISHNCKSLIITLGIKVTSSQIYFAAIT